MLERLVLRPESTADAEFLFDLYASTRAAEMAMVDWSEPDKLKFLQMQFHAQSQYYLEQFRSASFDLIELDAGPIGRLYVDEGENEIRIIDIALMPAYYRQGIGSYFLNRLIERSEKRNCRISIHVEQNNPATALYQRLGFRRVSDQGVYWFMQRTPNSAQENTAS